MARSSTTKQPPSLESKNRSDGKRRGLQPVSPSRSPSGSTPPAPAKLISARGPSTAVVDMVLEGEEEKDEEENSFDKIDDMSESMPSHVSVGSGSQDGEEVSKNGSISQSQKARRGGKKLKVGVSVSPSKKVVRAKRAACWKYFSVVNVPSKKDKGAMVSMAKCRWCRKTYAYQPGGATSQLNRHLEVCTQYQNKLAKVKAQVNLVVNDGLHPIEDLIGKLRDTVKYFKKSPARMYKFVEVCNNYSVKVGKGLCLDVKTRWSSTYKMLASCIEYKDAFTYYKDVDSKYQWEPTESEWGLYGKIEPILKAMAGVTTAFSGSTYPTANEFYPYIVTVKIALFEAIKSGDAYVKCMAEAMLDKFNKYWEERNNVMVIATILDPRFKMRYIKWCFAQMYDSLKAASEIDEINTELERLYNVFEIDYRHKKGSGSKSGAESSTHSKDTSASLASVVSSGFQSFLQSSSTEVSKSELLIYLDEANVSLHDKDFKLLDYWRINAHRFPVVSRMARKFLAVPASSVSSESTFSTGGRILDDYRSSLRPDMVQALVCASS